MLAQVPFIPFVHSAEDVVFAFYVFMRVSGLLFFSPFLSSRNLPGPLKVLFSAFLTALISIAIYPNYRGENPQFKLFEDGQELFLLKLILDCVQELFTGYLLGILFAIINESLMIAAQLCSIMMGFSMSRMIDPISGNPQALLGQLFMITGTVIIFLLDLHHVPIYLLAKSFSYIPLASIQTPIEGGDAVIQGSARMWHYGLKYAALPCVILLLITVGLGFMAKIMPEMNIFMVGFPVKIFIGYYSLIACVKFFPLLLRQAYLEYENLALYLLKLLGNQG